VQRNNQIFSAIFIVVFALLHLQPLYVHGNEKAKASCTKKMSTCGKKMQCHKPKPAEDNKDCESNGCNPFVPCSMGACCWLVENFLEHDTYIFIPKERLLVFNDNSLSAALSECWHPPESII
jgi:hypothetical protein